METSQVIPSKDALAILSQIDLVINLKIYLAIPLEIPPKKSLQKFPMLFYWESVRNFFQEIILIHGILLKCFQRFLIKGFVRNVYKVFHSFLQSSLRNLLRESFKNFINQSKNVKPKEILSIYLPTLFHRFIHKLLPEFDFKNYQKLL